MVTLEEESRRKAQEVDYEVNQSWTAVHQTIAKIMLKCLDDREALKISTRLALPQYVLRGRRVVKNTSCCSRFSDKEQTRS